jgi:hypothetical protein
VRSICGVVGSRAAAYLDPFAVDPAGILAPGKQDIWPRAWRV